MKSLFSILLLTSSFQAAAATLSEIIERECPGETNVEINGVVAPCIFKGYVVVFDTSKRWAEAKAVELGDKTNRVGGVVLIGSKQDEGYKKAHDLIYGTPLPIELNSLKMPSRGI